ncbi:AbrB/MazE/SpoVT family DNA-binding domain-containing protein [Klenkia sp. LSe6-5]|uniref:AbrB/MazE/SpoVT family DNA-binding domain-containing protein n=1 Tax=Klenkia sesuvii TaxID=3103137 RepID=A0ABU8DQ74_9ACTN
METTIDGAGRLVVPKALRDALGLTPGATVDISLYGGGLQVVPGGRAARLVDIGDGKLAIETDGPVDDDLMFGLIDEGRR